MGHLVQPQFPTFPLLRELGEGLAESGQRASDRCPSAEWLAVLTKAMGQLNKASRAGWGKAGHVTEHGHGRSPAEETARKGDAGWSY